VPYEVLIVAPEMPYPSYHGWALRHTQLIRALTSACVCDLIVLTPADAPCTAPAEEAARTKLGVRRLVTVPLPRKSKPRCAAWGLVTGRPLGALLYDAPRLPGVLEGATADGAYGACLLLGDLCMAHYARYIHTDRIVWDLCDDLVLGFARRAAVARGVLLPTYYRWQARIVERYLRKVCRAFDAALVIAEKDGASLRRFFDKPIVETPSTVDLDHYRPRPRDDEAKTLLFTGAMRYYPNRHAARFFVDEVFPLIEAACPGVRLQVVGKEADTLDIEARPKVTLTGFVEDLADYYCACNVFVCPLQTGTGIKYKLLEAMACGCAVVTTTVGAEGLRVQDGRELLVADTAADFAAAVTRLLGDRDLRHRLGAAARAFTEREFAAEKTAERLVPIVTGA